MQIFRAFWRVSMAIKALAPCATILFLTGCALPRHDAAMRMVAAQVPVRVDRQAPAPEMGLSLEERMAAEHVPGVSIAIVEHGRIVGVQGFGVSSVLEPAPVTPQTRFQVASISKVFAALAVMKQVDRGLFDLDRDIAAYLTGWQLQRTYEGPPREVSLRQLLAHHAGTSVSGFQGYPRDGAELPTLEAILSGGPRANSAAVVADELPGSELRYSGGGYTIIQALIEERGAGASFARFVESDVLRPLGMQDSTYALPAERTFASGHDEQGQIIPGGYRLYPEAAAAGLWSTPRDLARMMIDVSASYRGHGGTLISPSGSRAMLTPQNEVFGLGVMLAHHGEDLLFQHGGANAGYRGYFVMNATRGRGVVVLTNSDTGRWLARDLVLRAAQVYGWPELDETTVK